ncbi:MAG: hypothetical protein K8T20_12475 [Planctomycetes bacterium]|nr:hypothetical protein [Planctomycetota bacterium]
MKRWTLLLFLCAGCAARSVPPPAEPAATAPESSFPAAMSIAGEYSAGITGAWRSFDLNADGTWASQSGCCVGLNGGHRGHWKESDGRAWLRVEEEMGSCGWQDQPEWTKSDGMIPLTILRWGERVYLIADQEWLHFVNDVNQKMEPREHGGGWFLLRSGDDDKPAPGLPRVPDEWNSWLLPEPVCGEILEVLPDGLAIASLGSRDGLRKDMVLTVAARDGYGDLIQALVVSAKEDRCILRKLFEHADDGSIQEGMVARSTFFRPGR